MDLLSTIVQTPVDVCVCLPGPSLHPRTDALPGDCVTSARRRRRRPVVRKQARTGVEAHCLRFGSSKPAEASLVDNTVQCFLHHPDAVSCRSCRKSLDLSAILEALRELTGEHGEGEEDGECDMDWNIALFGLDSTANLLATAHRSFSETVEPSGHDPLTDQAFPKN